MPCPGYLTDDGNGNCVDPQTGVAVVPSSFATSSSTFGAQGLTQDVSPASSVSLSGGADLSSLGVFFNTIGHSIATVVQATNTAPTTAGRPAGLPGQVLSNPLQLNASSTGSILTLIIVAVIAFFAFRFITRAPRG